jgi:hypothetical protein
MARRGTKSFRVGFWAFHRHDTTDNLDPSYFPRWCQLLCGLIRVVKPLLISIFLLVMLMLVGCETEQAQRPTYDPDTQVVITKNEYARLQKAGRFQPFKDVTAVALDTSTGELCKTHDWQPSLEPLCPKNGRITEPCLMERSPYENAPLCSSLP